MDDLAPTQAERARRRDRKRVTRMVIDGGNLRRQLESLSLRSDARRRARSAAEPPAERPQP
jgi:hypothetical protein